MEDITKQKTALIYALNREDAYAERIVTALKTESRFSRELLVHLGSWHNAAIQNFLVIPEGTLKVLKDHKL